MRTDREVQPNADRFSDAGDGNANDPRGGRYSRRTGKFVSVVYIAVTATSAGVDHVDDCAVDNDAGIIDHPDVDAAATNGGAAANPRFHHTAAAPSPSDALAAA